MLPIPSNALERSSAQALGLITGYFQDLGCTILFDDTIHFDDSDDENREVRRMTVVTANMRLRLVNRGYSYINSLTAKDGRDRPLFYELRWRVFTCRIFIRSQS